MARRCVEIVVGSMTQRMARAMVSGFVGSEERAERKEGRVVERVTRINVQTGMAFCKLRDY